MVSSCFCERMVSAFYSDSGRILWNDQCKYNYVFYHIKREVHCLSIDQNYRDHDRLIETHSSSLIQIEFSNVPPGNIRFCVLALDRTSTCSNSKIGSRLYLHRPLRLFQIQNLHLSCVPLSTPSPLILRIKSSYKSTRHLYSKLCLFSIL